MTPRGRTLTRIFLALVYAFLVFEPQALAVSQKATASASVPVKPSTLKELKETPARPASKSKSQPQPSPQPQEIQPQASLKPQAPKAQALKPQASPQPADTPEAVAAPVDPVIVTELRWDGERLIVGTDRLLRFRSFALREPDRVVVDLFDAELGDPTMSRVLTVQRDPIRQIRIGAHPEEGFLRVVIDCDRPLPIQIAQPRGLPRLVIQPQGLAPAEPEPTVTKLAATTPAPKAVRPEPKAQEKKGPEPKAQEPTAQEPKTQEPKGRAAKAEAAKAEAVKPETPKDDAPKGTESSGKKAPETAAKPTKAQQAKSTDAKASDAKAPEKALDAKLQEPKTQEQVASRSAAPRTAREEVGVQLSQSGGSTLLKLQGARALRLRIQQEVEPSRLVVQVPAGLLKGKLPKAKGQVEALEVREEGEAWVLEARLPEGPLDIQNRLEDDGKTLVLAIQRQAVANSKRPLILIDPGHGGDDPGALGAGGTRESEVNLAIALKLQEALQARGVNAVLTRTGDVSLDLASRARMVDRLGAQALVSVHANSHDVPSALGLETYYRTPVSQPFAQQIHQVLVNDLQRPDRGVREARLFVLRHPTIPSALIEAGFISNPEEEGLLADREYQKKAAEAIAKGIASYLSTPVAELSH